MKKPFLIFAAALCVSAISGQADAACWGGTCIDADGNSYTANPTGSSATTRNFNSGPAGEPGSMAGTRFGNFTLYSGVSQSNAWDNRPSHFGNGLNGSASNSQGQSDSPYCALYGTCR
jgi:hypothetical protein